MLHRQGESDSQYLDNLAGIFQSGEEGFGGGRQQMQQHARERQDGQTTLGPQSLRETILVSVEARH